MIDWFAETTILVAMLVILVAVVGRVGRLSPSLRHALWIVVLLKLLTPPVGGWSWQLPRWWDSPPGTSAVTDAEESNEWIPEFIQDSRVAPEPLPKAPSPSDLVFSEIGVPRASDERPSFVEGDAALSVANEEEVAGGAWLAWQVTPPGVEDPLAVSWSRVPLRDTAWWAWLCGALVVGAVEMTRILRMGRFLRGARPAPEDVRTRVQDLARSLRLPVPRVLLHPGSSPPLVWSVGRTRLVLPGQLVTRLRPDALDGVIIHELAHLKRRDHWVGWLLLVAGVLWWWNPLFWYVRRQVHQNAELACDAWVVERRQQIRRVYAQALIEVSKLLARDGAPAAALSAAGRARHAFERRLTMIVRERVRAKLSPAGLAAVGLLALVALPAWSQSETAGGGGVSIESTSSEEQPEVLEPVPDLPGAAETAESPSSGVAAPPESPAPPTDRLERVERRLEDLRRMLEGLVRDVRRLQGSQTRTVSRYTGPATVQPGSTPTPRTRSAATASANTRRRPTTSTPSGESTPTEKSSRSRYSTTTRSSAGVYGLPPSAGPSAPGSWGAPQMDTVSLATHLAEAVREQKVAEVRLESAKARVGGGQAALAEVQIAEIDLEAARDKHYVLLRLAETYLRASEDELASLDNERNSLQRSVEAGVETSQKLYPIDRQIAAAKAHRDMLQAIIKRLHGRTSSSTAPTRSRTTSTRRESRSLP